MTRKERRKIASEFVKKINTSTFCKTCGKQPIEWHRDEHKKYSNARVSSLRTQGASVERIRKEIALCIPFCRVCHMIEDGRLQKLRKAQPQQKGEIYVSEKPCACCNKLTKPLRKNMCSTCDNHHSGRRLRKTKSCDGCCAELKYE